MSTVDKLTEPFPAKVLRKCSESMEAKQQFFSKYAESLDQMSRALADRFEKGGRLFAMGNGGSLCDALHIAVEFNHPIIEKRLAFPAIPLMTDYRDHDRDQQRSRFHAGLCESAPVTGHA